ncbi:MAG: hypothetical protein WBK55_01110 [Alphaproteobacteria bacterium]
MRPLALFIFIALPAVFASPAHAEGNPATGPMHYTRIQETAPDSGTTHIRMKTVSPGKEPPKQEEQAPSVRIWNKYKALAAGKPEMTEEEKTAVEEADKKEAEEKAAAAEKAKQEEEEQKSTKVEREPAPPTGIAAILDEYRRNKAQRSQMRTITVTNPADFEPSAGAAKENPAPR